VILIEFRSKYWLNCYNSKDLLAGVEIDTAFADPLKNAPASGVRYCDGACHITPAFDLDTKSRRR
jgi:hypothetical protein